MLIDTNGLQHLIKMVTGVLPLIQNLKKILLLGDSQVLIWGSYISKLFQLSYKIYSPIMGIVMKLLI